MKLKNLLFFNSNLDGITSILILKWRGLSLEDSKLIPVDFQNLRKFILSWLLQNSFENYDKVYFVGINTSQISDIINFENIHSIYHHDSKKKNSNSVVFNETSTASMLLKDFDVDEKKKKLVKIVDDYINFRTSEGFELAFILEKVLASSKNRWIDFMEKYADGYCLPSKEEAQRISMERGRFERVFQTHKLFCLNLGKISIISCVGGEFEHESIFKILTEKKADIAIFTNPLKNSVSFRKKEKCSFDLSFFSDKFEGWGFSKMSSCTINPKFLEFSRKFTPLTDEV